MNVKKGLITTNTSIIRAEAYTVHTNATDFAKDAHYNIKSYSDVVFYIDINSDVDKKILSQLIIADGAVFVDDAFIELKTMKERVQFCINRSINSRALFNYYCKLCDTYEQAVADIPTLTEADYHGARTQLAKNTVLTDAVQIDSFNQVTDDRAVVKAKTGSGKTEQLVVPAINKALADDKNVVYITVSRALVSSMQIDDLVDYRTLTPSTENVRNLKTCINSIHKPVIAEIIKNADVIVIDEVAKVLEQILVSNMNNRAEVFSIFKDLVAKSDKQLVAVDADVNDFTKAFFDATFYELKSDYSGLTVNIKEHDAVYALACASSNALIATDNKREAERLYAAISASADNNALLITADTIIDDEQQAFIADTSKCSQYTHIIYTPAVGSGISITTDHFDNYYALLHGNITNLEAIQLIRRDRTATAFTVGIKHNSALKKGFKFSGSELDLLIKEATDSRHFISRNFRQVFIETLRKMKFNVTVCTEKVSAKDVKRNAKELDNANYEREILDADNRLKKNEQITTRDADDNLLAKTDARMLEVINMRKVFRLCNQRSMYQYVTTDHIEAWERGNLKTWIDNINLADTTFDDKYIAEIEESNAALASTDKGYDHKKAPLLKAFKDYINREEIIDPKAFVDQMINAGWNTVGLPEMRVTKYPITVVKRLAKELFGYKIKARNTRKNGEQLRYYYICKATRDQIHQYL